MGDLLSERASRPRLPFGEPAATREWRARLLDGLLWTTVALMTIALPVMVIQTGSHLRPGWSAWIVVAYLVVGWAALARRSAYRLRAVALLTGLFAVAMLGVLRVGFQAGPGAGAALIVVSAGLLLGRRALVLTFALTICCILGLGMMHIRNGGVLLAPQAGNALLVGNWLRTTMSYSLFTGVLAVAVMFVVSHVERTLAARTHALDELRAEQQQREQAERALREANEQILQMQKLEAIGRLAGGVAHDFNNTLVVILGWADFLREGKPSEKQLNDALDEIAMAASRAGRLTQQLLSFGRKAVHVPQAVSLERLIPKVLSMLARLLPENIELVSQIGADVPPVWGDPGQLHQLLVNLCLNARDAMPNGGKLEIVVEAGASSSVVGAPLGPLVSLVVRDNGSGMSEETRSRAFEPFFTTKGELGNGLGLSSVYGIVQQSGGHVSVESELGKGSQFTVLLRAARSSELSESMSPAKAAESTTATILVAEDEPAVRLLISEVLRSKGHVVLAAENGNAALELARRHRAPIDLLCTDGVMPGISSSELIAGFRRLFPEAQVLVCSGHIEDSPLLSEVSRQQVAFLSKPFTSAELTLAVARTLAEREAHGP